MQKNLSINSENILPIIKKWLYSEKDIFLRELVSNAADAITKLKTITSKSPDFRIDVKTEKNKLIIEDNGIGMTFDEVEKYICQVAFSGASDFVEKYKTESDGIIGHFGLGFYSSFMVADKVEIETLSYLEGEKPVFWSSLGSSEYMIEEGKKKQVGTKIILHISKENEEYAKEETVKKILQKYCPYLSYPIYLNEKHINNKDPLWLKNPANCADKEYLEFYRELYPFQDDPIFWIHLNVEYPFHLKGILYFPKIKPDFDISKNSIRLFCHRIFVSDNCKDILQDYLTVLQGALDSFDIPLNVSRSFLQLDANVKQIGQHISKKITDRLQFLFNSDREKFTSYWPDIEPVIKLGILHDEKFYERSRDFLIWKNANNSWQTLSEYQAVSKEKIFYIPEGRQSKDLLQLYTDKNLPVIFSHPYFDAAVFDLIERKGKTKFIRIDAVVDEAIIDKGSEKTLLDADGRTERSRLVDLFKEHLANDLEVQVQSLAKKHPIGFIVTDEAERRMSQYFGNMPLKKRLVVNSNNPVIMKLLKIKSSNPDLAKDLVSETYNLALLSSREFQLTDIDEIVSKSNMLLEKVLNTY